MTLDALQRLDFLGAELYCIIWKSHNLINRSITGYLGSLYCCCHKKQGYGEHPCGFVFVCRSRSHHKNKNSKNRTHILLAGASLHPSYASEPRASIVVYTFGFCLGISTHCHSSAPRKGLQGFPRCPSAFPVCILLNSIRCS